MGMSGSGEFRYPLTPGLIRFMNQFFFTKPYLFKFQPVELFLVKLYSSFNHWVSYLNFFLVLFNC